VYFKKREREGEEGGRGKRGGDFLSMIRFFLTGNESSTEVKNTTNEKRNGGGGCEKERGKRIKEREITPWHLFVQCFFSEVSESFSAGWGRWVTRGEAG